MATRKIKTFPAYMYHKNYNEPRRVDNQDQVSELENKGWVTRYLYKEYPKMVNGIICKDKATEELLLRNTPPKPKVVKDQIIKAPTGAMPDKTIAVAVPDMSGVESSPEESGAEYEIVNPDGEVIPDVTFKTWALATSYQKELNANCPGHKARKK